MYNLIINYSQLITLRPYNNGGKIGSPYRFNFSSDSSVETQIILALAEILQYIQKITQICKYLVK